MYGGGVIDIGAPSARVQRGRVLNGSGVAGGGVGRAVGRDASAMLRLGLGGTGRKSKIVEIGRTWRKSTKIDLTDTRVYVTH